MFGDSLTKYLEEGCSDVGGCDVALHCERGGTVSSIRENIASIENHLIGLTPDLIFLHVGTNDLQNILVDTIINQYRALLRSIRQIFPTTPVLVKQHFQARWLRVHKHRRAVFELETGKPYCNSSKYIIC